MTHLKTISFLAFLMLSVNLSFAQQSNYAKDNYTKTETYITMRDGVKLFTAIYTPKEASAEKKYPMLMQRTCYSIAPYGTGKYPSRLGPSTVLTHISIVIGYIFN